MPLRVGENNSFVFFKNLILTLSNYNIEEQ